MAKEKLTAKDYAIRLKQLVEQDPELQAMLPKAEVTKPGAR